MPDKEVTPRRSTPVKGGGAQLPDRPSISLAILGENLETIREVLYPRLTKKTYAKDILKIGEKQYGRITGRKVYPQLDMLDRIACQLRLQAWQLLVPGFHPRSDAAAAEAAEAAQAGIEEAARSLERARGLLASLKNQPPPAAE